MPYVVVHAVLPMRWSGRVSGPQATLMAALGEPFGRDAVGGGCRAVTQARTAGDAIGARAAGHLLDDDAWGDHATTADQHAVPQVFFTDPEAASVGLTAEQAERAGHRTKIVDLDFNAAQGANLHADNYPGHARLVVDVDRDILLGVTFVGPGVSELLHSATVAVAGEVPLKRLQHAVACFPTVSEIWLFLLAAYQRDRD